MATCCAASPPLAQRPRRAARSLQPYPQSRPSCRSSPTSLPRVGRPSLHAFGRRHQAYDIYAMPRTTLCLTHWAGCTVHVLALGILRAANALVDGARIVPDQTIVGVATFVGPLCTQQFHAVGRQAQ